MPSMKYDTGSEMRYANWRRLTFVNTLPVHMRHITMTSHKRLFPHKFVQATYEENIKFRVIVPLWGNPLARGQ